VAASFIGGGNRNIRGETTDMSHVTDQLYQIMLYRIHVTPPGAGFELTTLVVIGTDCIGSYKSNYHTTTTAPKTYNQESELSSVQKITVLGTSPRITFEL
jgi:hypothetical protein